MLFTFSFSFSAMICINFVMTNNQKHKMPYAIDHLLQVSSSDLSRKQASENKNGKKRKKGRRRRKIFFSFLFLLARLLEGWRDHLERSEDETSSKSRQ